MISSMFAGYVYIVFSSDFLSVSVSNYFTLINLAITLRIDQLIVCSIKPPKVAEKVHDSVFKSFLCDQQFKI